MHSRAAIRTAVVAALQGKTAAGARVFPSRYMPVPDSELPAICVFIPGEAVTDQDELSYRRIATIAVEAVVTDFDDETGLDALTAQIEQALAMDWTLGGLVETLRLRRVEIHEDDRANRNILLGALQYEAPYVAPSYFNGEFADLDSADAMFQPNLAQDHILLQEATS